MVWLVPPSGLTRDQLSAVKADDRKHKVIIGGPGSGKTQALVHRADYLRRRRRVPDDKYRIFAFTNLLADYIGSDLDMLDIPQENVMTYDSWCRQTARKHIGRGAASGTPDDVRITVAKWAKQAGSQLPMYDFVLVDEGQDLSPEVFDTLSRVARHVTVCVDDKQRIYPQGSAIEQVLDTLNLKRYDRNLLETYRCTEYIVSLSARFILDQEERKRYIKQRRTMDRERKVPLLYRAQTRDDEVERLAEALRGRIREDQQIAVLLSDRWQIQMLGSELEARGIQVELQRQDDIDFDSKKPKLITFHSAKGLTFDSALIPFLDEFRSAGTAEDTNLLFVGTSRAVKWIYLSYTADAPQLTFSDALNDASSEPQIDLPILQCLEPLIAEGGLTVQRTGSTPQFDDPNVSEGSDDLLDFL